ncbi:MAG: hypothetical protein LAO23_06035 [Acidobacteriia bacterium]|nr:hypothetical protein [Terriglobia bacterium]
MVIDEESVERRPLGATAWSKVKGREYDEIAKDEGKEEQTGVKKNEMSKETQEFLADLQHLTEGVGRDPDFLTGDLATWKACRRNSGTQVLQFPNRLWSRPSVMSHVCQPGNIIRGA